MAITTEKNIKLLGRHLTIPFYQNRDKAPKLLSEKAIPGKPFGLFF